MGKLSFSRILNNFCVSPGSNSCFCISSFEAEDEIERKTLTSDGAHLFRLKDLVDGNQTLAFHSKPKVSSILPKLCQFISFLFLFVWVNKRKFYKLTESMMIQKSKSVFLTCIYFWFLDNKFRCSSIYIYVYMLFEDVFTFHYLLMGSLEGKSKENVDLLTSQP